MLISSQLSLVDQLLSFSCQAGAEEGAKSATPREDSCSEAKVLLQRQDSASPGWCGVACCPELDLAGVCS